ncbi:MAG: hypothetical protein ABF289_19725 [Clostridiales bacterium]
MIETSKYDQKILPIKYPIVNGYRYYAKVFSIIFNKKNCFEWISNNFLTLEFPRLETLETHYFGMCLFTMSRNYYEECPYIDKSIINQDLVNLKWENICDFLRDVIDMNYYIELDLDTYYVSHATKFYKNIHYSRPTFIYGFNNKTEIFNIAGYYYHSKYSFEELSYENILKAYDSKHSLEIKGIKADDIITLYKLKDNNSYRFDKALFVKRIKEYLNSYNFRNDVCNPSDQATFQYCEYGFKAYEFLKKLLDLGERKIPLKRAFSNLFQSIINIDIRSFYCLWEHKKLMLLILKYVKEKEYINIDKDSIEKYDKVEKKSNLIINLIIKYNITQEKYLIEKCKNILDEIANEERKILENIVNSINISKSFYYQYKADIVIKRYPKK